MGAYQRIRDLTRHLGEAELGGLRRTTGDELLANRRVAKPLDRLTHAVRVVLADKQRRVAGNFDDRGISACDDRRPACHRLQYRHAEAFIARWIEEGVRSP